MIAELLNSVSSDVVMGMAQAACAIAICLAVVVLCRRFAVHVERETIRTSPSRWSGCSATIVRTRWSCSLISRLRLS